MTEPHTSTVIAAAGSISLAAGTLFGLPLPALLFGLAGGLCAVWLDRQPRTLWARIATVAMGTICAAAAAQPLAAEMHPDGRWLLASALVIGYGAETLLRTFLQAIVNRIRQIGGTGVQS